MARILVIDDSPTVVTFAKHALESAGHEVDGLLHFVDLRAHLNRTPPDLVLLDLEMPGLSGEKVGEFLRQFETRRTPIIVYSARDREELEAAAQRLGAAAVVEKGASQAQLRMVVSLALADGALGQSPGTRSELGSRDGA